MRWVTVTLALGILAPAAQAQTEPKPPPANANQSIGAMGLWDADVMMEQATINISRRYNLDQNQEEYTRQLLRKRTKEFLNVYEDDMRKILKELFMQQLSGGEPDSEQTKDWGQRAAPLLEASKKAILDGNMEWRDILSDEQKKIHDLDLRLMDHNFKLLENRFGRWQEGQFQPGDWMGSPTARAPRPQRSTTPATPPQPVEARSAEDYWEIFVKKFIRDYQLDEAQRNSALAVLEDVRDKAARVRQKTEVDRKRTQTELQRLIKEKAPAGEIREWSRKRRELDVPISALFEELKSRLAKIPTEAQRRRVPDDYISKPPATRPSQEKAPTSQEAEKPAEEKAKAEQPKTAPAEKAQPAPPEKKPK